MSSLLRQFMPIHAGHDDVGEQQVNGTGVGLRHLQRGSPVHCSQDRVALVQKILVGEAKKIRFVLDDENRFLAVFGFGGGRGRFRSDAASLIALTRGR